MTGVITQANNGEDALEIEDSAGSATLYVKLDSQYRNDFSPQNNPSVIGETLHVSGKREVYMGCRIYTSDVAAVVERFVCTVFAVHT